MTATGGEIIVTVFITRQLAEVQTIVTVPFALLENCEFGDMFANTTDEFPDDHCPTPLVPSNVPLTGTPELMHPYKGTIMEKPLQMLTHETFVRFTVKVTGAVQTEFGVKEMLKVVPT
jgi:hypothetical protein